MIDHFLILVHPCPYEAIARPDDDPYRALERAVCERWLGAIASLQGSTFAVQIDGAGASPSPDRLHAALTGHLGPERVARIPVEFVSPEDPVRLREYYRQIEQRVRGQMAAGGLTFAPATATATIWGQSFEGCASGYGSAVACALRLTEPTRLDYAMSVPDAPYLLGATLLQTVPLSGSDILAYLFGLRDGRCAAFFRSCLTPQWLDYRPILLRLGPVGLSVLTKNTGAVAWPPTAVPPAEQAAASRFNEWRAVPWPASIEECLRGRLALSTVQERYVVAADLGALMDVVNSAEVARPVQGQALGYGGRPDPIGG